MSNAARRAPVANRREVHCMSWACGRRRSRTKCREQFAELRLAVSLGSFDADEFSAALAAGRVRVVDNNRPASFCAFLRWPLISSTILSPLLRQSSGIPQFSGPMLLLGTVLGDHSLA